MPAGMTSTEVARVLLQGAENKRTKASADTVLLLDAYEVPWLALDEVVTEFRRLYGALPSKLGFKAVYVVPWQESAVRRLD